MIELRATAYRLGYTIYYPGLYAPYAKLTPTYNFSVSNKSFEICMKNHSKGLIEIKTILDKLSTKVP